MKNTTYKLTHSEEVEYTKEELEDIFENYQRDYAAITDIIIPADSTPLELMDYLWNLGMLDTNVITSMEEIKK